MNRCLAKLRKEDSFEVCTTADTNRTVAYLKQKHREVESTTLVDGRLRSIPSLPYFSFDLLKQNVKAGFSSAYFQYYLKLRRVNGLSDAKIDVLRGSFSSQKHLADAFEQDLDATRNKIANFTLPGSRNRFGPKLVEKIEAAFSCDSYQGPSSGSDASPEDSSVEDYRETIDLVDSCNYENPETVGVRTSASDPDQPETIVLIDSSDDEKLPAKDPPRKSSEPKGRQGVSEQPAEMCQNMIKILDSSDDEKEPAIVTPEKLSVRRPTASRKRRRLEF